MLHFGIVVVVVGHVIGLLILESWIDALELCYYADHVQVVLLAGSSTAGP